VVSNIDDLKKKVERLTDQLKDAREKLHTAMIADCPIKPGIVYENLVTGERAQVQRAVIRWGRVEPSLVMIKKDGTPGKRVVPYWRVHNWMRLDGH
jgi:hypothetical protein